MSENRLKIGEVASLIKENDHTVRNWIRDFREHIPIEKAPNGYNLFTQESIKVIREIQQLYRQQGFSTKQIKMHFLNIGIEESPPIQTSTLDSDIQEIKDTLQRQMEFNQALLQRLDDQQAYIDHAIRDRDQQLMQTLRSLQNKKDTTWWKFWNKNKP